jgi:hypothetical protein
MAQRTVLKILGSFGPAGSIAIFAEKAMKAYFPDAYDLGNPQHLQTEIEKKVKEQRSKFVEEIFDFKSKFETEVKSDDKGRVDAIYESLTELITKHVKEIVKFEKIRINRERVYYKSVKDDLRAERCVQEINNIEDDTKDNLTKMVQNILHPDPERFQQATTHIQEGSVTERITRNQAETYLHTWKNL